MSELKDKLITIQGGQYLQVQHRILWFREDHPDASIVTDLITHDPEQEYALMRAIVTTEGGGQSTAYGSALAGKLSRNKEKYLEFAETRAVGRALAFAGYSTAGAQDLDEGDEPVDAPSNPSQQQTTNGPQGVVMISSAQVAEINRLLPLAGMKLTELLGAMKIGVLRELSDERAVAVIGRLMARSLEKDPLTPPAAPADHTPAEVAGDSGEVIGITTPTGGWTEAAATPEPSAFEQQQAAQLAEIKDKTGVLARQKFDHLNDEQILLFCKAYLEKPVRNWTSNDYDDLYQFIKWFPLPDKAISFIANPQQWVSDFNAYRRAGKAKTPTVQQQVTQTKRQAQVDAVEMTDDMFDQEPKDFDAMFPQGETHPAVPAPAAEPAHINPPVPRRSTPTPTHQRVPANH